MIENSSIEDSRMIEMALDPSRQEQGYKLLMDKYQFRLYQHIRRMTGNHDDTDDVLQNTFIKVFKNLKNFQGNAKLYTWMYKIATNETLSFIQRNKRHLTVDINKDESSHIENTLKSDKQLDPTVIKEWLYRAIEVLPLKQKSVFSMRYFDEMSYREMSVVTNTSEGALKASFHHAVKKIEHYFRTANIY